ncbi:MAG: rhodanese-like domain-containing protein [Labilithrix sp.]|nr:rhodanese-like domain-containing protein [Labilithrix sp.]MCW5817274.1 rhodanese-like domain-containing protein [Labilithrix sp.]
MNVHHERNGRDRVRTVDPELLHHQVRSGRSIVVVDVRPTAAYRGSRGRIPGAISLPIAQLVARRAELEQHRHRPIVVVADDEAGSRLGALELEVAGFTEVSALEGGMQRWLELRLPIVVPTPPPPPLPH